MNPSFLCLKKQKGAGQKSSARRLCRSFVGYTIPQERCLVKGKVHFLFIFGNLLCRAAKIGAKNCATCENLPKKRDCRSSPFSEDVCCYVKKVKHRRGIAQNHSHCFSTSKSLASSSGLAICSFIPVFFASCTSSAKALAVMAMIGTLPRLPGRARIAAVAS